MPQSAGQAGETDCSSAFPFTTVALLGGTGSLGWALTAYLLRKYPHIKIRVYSRGEHRQAALYAQFPQERRLSFLIGDVREKLATLPCSHGRTARHFWTEGEACSHRG